jgi:hypothetical protein
VRTAGITSKGRAALRDDRCQNAQLLIVELASRMGPVEQDHLVDLATELLDHYGTPENAVTALRTGEVKLQKIE